MAGFSIFNIPKSQINKKAIAITITGSLMNVVKKEFKFGNHQVTLETGRIARQASGAVLVSMGDTIVLVTCC